MYAMTRDKCVYEIRVTSDEDSMAVRNHVENSNYDEDFSTEVTEEKMVGDDIVFTIEVYGDSYEILLFEEGFSEIPNAEVIDADP